MNKIEVKEGVLFIDGVRVELKKGESHKNLIYGELNNEKVFIFDKDVYRGKDWISTEHIGTITQEEFLELKNTLPPNR